MIYFLLKIINQRNSRKKTVTHWVQNLVDLLIVDSFINIFIKK